MMSSSVASSLASNGAFRTLIRFVIMTFGASSSRAGRVRPTAAKQTYNNVSHSDKTKPSMYSNLVIHVWEARGRG